VEAEDQVSYGIQIDLVGIECNTDTADADGVTWECGPVDGWSGPDSRKRSLAPSGRHGLFTGSGFYEGRPLRIQGAAYGPPGDSTQAAAWAAYNRLAALLDVNDEGDLIVYEPTPKLVTVQIAPGTTPLISDPVNNLIEWDFSLLAPHPFKTALTPTVTSLAGGASTTLTNAGTKPAYPVITTTSSGTVDLVIGGRHFTTGTLPIGAVIDMWERTLVDGSGDPLPTAKTPESEWLALPVGGTGVDQDGTAALSISHYATFN
jgi:phage-related protein